MPSNLPSSFASAAAGQNATRGGRGGGSDWNRRDGRSTNGTLTLRRSSTTPLSHHSQTPSIDSGAPLSSTEISAATAQPVYEVSPARYKKDDLLAMAQGSRSPRDVSNLLHSEWHAGHANGGANPRAWGKSNENHIPQEPGACWDDEGGSTALGLQNLTADEQEAFMGDVNSTVKPPTLNKDGTNPAGVNGRKASLSQGAGNNFGLGSPSSATRPGTRRRETSDANQFGVSSPTASAGRGGREDPPWFSRRNTTDVKESTSEDAEAEPQGGRQLPNPIGSLMRTNTSGSAGIGGIWNSSQPTTPSATGGFGNFALGGAVGEKRAPAPSGGGSRLAHLMPKDAENTSGRPAEGQGQGQGQSALNQSSWRSRQRTDTDPFGEDLPTGSAALGGAQDTGPQASRAGTLGTPVKGSAGDFGMSGLNLGGHQENGPASPSETNPFRSPPTDRQERDDDDGAGGANKPYQGFGHDVPGYNPLQRAFGGNLEGHDRSQTSSATGRGFPLGHVSAWGAPGTATPDRERAGFGGAPFSPAAFNNPDNAPSPGLGNMSSFFGNGPGAGPGAIGTNSIGRGSKMGSLFPAAMQAQMQQAHEQHESMGEAGADPRLAAQLGAIGRNNFPAPGRDSESPMRSGRGGFENLFPSIDPNRAQHGQLSLQNMFDTSDLGGMGPVPQSFTPVSGSMPFGGGSQPGMDQQQQSARTMVMPDRMRWVYLDPKGVVQGAFTGLEMNDWYKANFFSPDLRVKKVEDVDFEPLGQLIRRIGNSREPFLVPQVGVAHGDPSPAAAFPPSNTGGVVPPLHNLFPSFGRTLTAEEQNNLERRKQEEQIVLAQQRDFAMRQQAMARFPGQPGLQHHSSAQSLQSQPSFGNMAQGQMGQHPGGMQNAFFDQAGEGHGAQGLSSREFPSGAEDLTNMSQHDRQILADLASDESSTQAIAAAVAESSLHGVYQDLDDLADDPEGFKQRLNEFHQLRAEREAQDPAHQADPARAAAEAAQAADAAASAQQAPQEGREGEEELAPKASKAPRPKGKGKPKYVQDPSLSLTQQVQQTQAAAAAAIEDIEPGMPRPFPPPSSTTPLPAPTAQRVRSNLPDQYNRSRSTSPAETQPPPTAPWAKDSGNSEGSKGPSLKEIQEAEARKAAKAEQAASAIRKAALEQEAALLREKEKNAAAVAAGLPASSTWGHASPVDPASPWMKPGATKPTAGVSVTPVSASKKTLAEIQAEEERRKQKAKGSAAPSGAPPSASKSYANLAGKPGQPAIPSGPAAAAASAAAPPPGAGWATVGAGGKVKAPPVGPSAGSPARAVSAALSKPANVPLKPMSRPGPAAASVSSANNNTNAALDEFRKWCHRELSRGISVSDVSGFASNLEALPLEPDLIADAIYANSTIMDGRHFATEFVRRKKLADRGVTEKGPATPSENKASISTGGWSEVAKKTGGNVALPAEEPTPVGFKVVASKKKAKK
ncbi:uncharacterized protein F5Z01DRAFT_711345 [Emericellopsis atlantica]|uniref:GYF domain-containing protein n=1 Tax=Emericellopsis atlantica TaxID=2614577 RepID=A0A9P7ZI20_9HYPO|nr:uncharacterized protein F5Z01DRAFT_711345 [Emericellopsis atlantica]KAG9251883.1 hypothetical protein F5Z01DRAFT_711345 [Emericellopsis atlantica]